MTEPCDLTATAARRLIGARQLSPVELVESCIARIEAVDHAVNAVVARDFDRARAAAREGGRGGGDARRRRCGALHGLPVGDQGSRRDRGAAHHLRQPDLRATTCRGTTSACVASLARGGRDRPGQDQHAGVRRRRQHPQRGLRRDRQSVRSARRPAPAPPAARRWRWRPAWCRSPPAPTWAARCATRRRSAASSASARRRGWCRASGAASAGTPLSTGGPMARTVADLSLMLSAMVSDDARDPLATTVHGRQIRRAKDFTPLPPVDLSRLRVAFTPDFGFAPDRAADPRNLRRPHRPAAQPGRARGGCDAGLHRRRRGLRGRAWRGLPGRP